MRKEKGLSLDRPMVRSSTWLGSHLPKNVRLTRKYYNDKSDKEKSFTALTPIWEFFTLSPREGHNKLECWCLS